MNQGEKDSWVRTSKYLSLILRHRPTKINLVLDDEGWGSIAYIIKETSWLTRALIDEAVEKNDKQRFSISEDGKKIRANQGHSIQVDLKLKPHTPPEFLYHGTYGKVVGAIMRDGLRKMRRHHVHLSEESGTAVAVGRRSGAPVLFKVKALEMHNAGYTFYLSENGVWLVSDVPPHFLIMAAARG